MLPGLAGIVFIALATLIIVRFLHFPYKNLQNKKAERIAQQIVYVVVILTLLPSIYFGYDLVKRNRFLKDANRFVTNEAHFPNDYLLNSKINPKKKKILLVFGGNIITEKEIEDLKVKLKNYELQEASLEIKQGFSYLSENKNEQQNDQLKQLTKALEEKDKIQVMLQRSLDSVKNQQTLSQQLYAELKAQYSNLSSAIIQPSTLYADSAKAQQTTIVLLSFNKNISCKTENFNRKLAKNKVANPYYQTYSPIAIKVIIPTLNG